MSAKPCSLSSLYGSRHFIFKFARLLVHQEQRKNAAGFSWVLVRKGAADGLGGWKELAAKPPSPRVSLPWQSPEYQARKVGAGSLFPARLPPGDGPVQGTVTWPPGPEHPDLSTLLTRPAKHLTHVFSYNPHNCRWGGDPCHPWFWRRKAGLEKLLPEQEVRGPHLNMGIRP